MPAIAARRRAHGSGRRAGGRPRSGRRAAATAGRGGPLGLADDRLGHAADRVAAGVALGQEPEDHARVAGRDRVLEHVEGQQLEPGEALLAAEAGEVAVVLDEAGKGGPGEEGVELGPGQALDAGDLGGRMPAASRMPSRRRARSAKGRGRRGMETMARAR